MRFLGCFDEKRMIIPLTHVEWECIMIYESKCHPHLEANHKAGKMDNGDLLTVLERICREHLVMKCLLHEDDERSWRYDVLASLQAEGMQKEIVARFGGVRDTLQTNQSYTVPDLIEVLNKTNLDNQPSWMDR
jgi:hypothetical protein